MSNMSETVIYGNRFKDQKMSYKEVITKDMKDYGEDYDKNIEWCSLSEEELDDRVSSGYEYLVYSTNRIYFALVSESIPFFSDRVFRRCSVSRSMEISKKKGFGIRTHGYVIEQKNDWFGGHDG